MPTNQSRILAEDAAIFLAWCGLRKALRHRYDLDGRRPGLVALVVPAGAPHEPYVRAARLAVLGAPYEYEGDREAPVVVDFSVEDGRNRWRRGPAGHPELSQDMAQQLRRRARMFAVVQDPAELPLEVLRAADLIAEVEGPTQRHVTAAARLYMKVELGAEAAEVLAACPIDVLGILLKFGRDLRTVLDRARRAAEQAKAGPSPLTIDQLPGLGAAADWGHELARDLSDWAEGGIGWSEVDRGVLLYGPPGTGKTTFARALGGTCGVPVIYASLARWQSRGHLGDLLRAMRRDFDEARQAAPSILFIDEVDAVGDRSRAEERNRQYHIEVVNGLLECLDGAEAREGVVVVGACNDPSRIDPAVLRAGRLDRIIPIPLPDGPARLGILLHHLRGALPGLELWPVVERTDGWSGADLERLVRDARRRARRDRRGITVADLVASLPTLAPYSPEARRRVAFHEAGHVIVGLTVRVGELRHVSIEEHFDPSAAVRAVGGTVFSGSADEPTADTVLAWLAVLMAGAAAEEAAFGRRSGGAGGAEGSDLHRATVLAAEMEASLGLGQGFAYLAPRDPEVLLGLVRRDPVVRARVEATLAERYGFALRILSRGRRRLNALAEALLAEGRLDVAGVSEVVAPGRGQ